MRRLSVIHTIRSMIDRRNGELVRFVRFLLVGLTGTGLDFFLLTVLKAWGGLPTVAANVISYSAGILNNFTLNRLWTFADSRSKPYTAQLGSYFLINIGGLTLNTLIVWLLEPVFVDLLDNPDIGYLPAKAIASMVAVCFNFVANRYWTFNDIGSDPPP